MKLLHLIELVREDLRYDPRRDWRASEIAQEMAKGFGEWEQELHNLIRDKRIAILFPGRVMPRTMNLSDETLISVDGATAWLVRKGIVPQVVVTDLDGLEVIPKEPVYVVLLHGDNLKYLYKVYEMEKVVFATQVFPKGSLLFTGGFTDGDRALALAMKYGAREVKLLNFDVSEVGEYSKPSDYPLLLKEKMRKLAWAERIVDFLLTHS
ncbi:MAG: 6-hydroxymethylpterin diphosphokinase MptE-like protein [Thermoprotei archaeon]